MTNGELIARIKNLYISRVISQENKPLTNRQVYNKLSTVRARVLSQEYNKQRTLVDECYQILPMALINVGYIFDTNTRVLKSQNRIPAIVTGKDGYLIQSVTNINAILEIYPINQEEAKYVQYNRYTGKSLYYYFADSFLYVKNSDSLKQVIVNGVFLNPLDLPDDLPNFLDRKFPVNSSLIDSIVTLTIEELLSVPPKQQSNQQQHASNEDPS